MVLHGYFKKHQLVYTRILNSMNLYTVNKSIAKRNVIAKENLLKDII